MREGETAGTAQSRPGESRTLAELTTALVVERPRVVVGVFLVLTVPFAVGLTNVTTETGTESFAENLPEQEALDAVNREFAPPFAPAESTTQLIQRDGNVLSREGLVEMLRIQEAIAERPDLRVARVTSVAAQVARTLDPDATTPTAQRRAVERATTPAIERAVRTAAADPGVQRLLSTDFNPASARASATVAVVTHEVPAAPEDTEPVAAAQRRMGDLVGTIAPGVVVFGGGILEAEFGAVIGDTLLLVVPASILLITLFLVVAYRDVLDLFLGMTGLALVVVWTFGALGLAGIPFDQILVAVPPLLLAVGIDYGLHAVNRYREERTAGEAIRPAMRITVGQLLVAFGIVTVTSAIGFASNLTSSLVPIQRFGVVAAIGIVVTALVFGVFLPAAKVLLDSLRERTRLPPARRRPISTPGSRVGRALTLGVVFARRSPAVFLALVLIVTALAGGYATGVDTEFSEENFLPAAETPSYLASLPEPFRPSDYSVTRTLDFLEERFETGEADTVTVYVRGPMESDIALEAVARASTEPPDTFVPAPDGSASATSILTVIQAQAAQDPEFAQFVRRNDIDGDGVPDRNLERIYDELLDSPARDAALSYLTENRRSARVVYAVEADAESSEVTADARTVAGRFPYAATATGEIVVFQTVADLILLSALGSLAVALAGTAIALGSFFWLLFGRPTLGLAGLVPIGATVALVAASMRALGISFNAFTATVLALTIGLGIDYAVHLLHRFADERREGATVDAALRTTVTGTGGALAGSMLTTVFGLGVLVLATFPAIGQFGLLAGLSVLYAFLTSVLVLPSVLALRARFARPLEAA
ncbi:MULTISPECIES: efflux RND transporter permease subunit [Salinibaculum]|uniref:efflux RND transporter permease subunit n=1 Tax=Salinibaculum TaxID=2732368 RepID=UPI0030D16E53